MAVCQAPGQRDGRLPGTRPALRAAAHPTLAKFLVIQSVTKRRKCHKAVAPSRPRGAVYTWPDDESLGFWTKMRVRQGLLGEQLWQD